MTYYHGVQVFKDFVESLFIHQQSPEFPVAQRLESLFHQSVYRTSTERLQEKGRNEKGKRARCIPVKISTIP